jgi:predicted type IV restriction endonuclease
MAATIAADPEWMLTFDHDTTSEAVSNGIWYDILQRYFSFPNFIIAPEQRNSKGSRPDLTVFALIRKGGALDSSEPIFTFEGKEPGQLGQMEASIKQAAGYLLPLSHARGVRFGIVASGSTFAVIAYNGSGTAGSVFQWTRADANASKYNIPKTWTLQSLTVADNVTTLDGFLADLATKF